MRRSGPHAQPHAFDPVSGPSGDGCYHPPALRRLPMDDPARFRQTPRPAAFHGAHGIFFFPAIADIRRAWPARARTLSRPCLHS
jgi:hypothetical protein